MAAGPPNRPSPISMPRRSSVPPATVMRKPERSFSQDWPNSGVLHAHYYLDTGVLYAMNRDSRCPAKFLRHYEGRLRVTDIIRDEVLQKACKKVDPSEQLVKNAALEAKRRVLDPGHVEVRETLLTERDHIVFDQLLNQFRSLETMKRQPNDQISPQKSQSSNKHAGEASAIICCTRDLQDGDQVVLLTNDGSAGQVALLYGITSRHFAHALHELVCAELLRPSLALEIFKAANKVTSVPRSEIRSHSTDFDCQRVSKEHCSRCPSHQQQPDRQ